MIAALILAVVVGGDTPLPDAAKETRAQALMREIRCVVCENEPVSHSTADIAVDMRRTIRTQVEAGRSNQEIRGFFAERYGQFVLFRPPTEGVGALVWVFPFALLAIFGGVFGRRLLTRRKRELAPESAEDLP